MKKLAAAIMALALCSGFAYGSGLGFFVSQWSPKDGDDTIGGGAKLEFGGDPLALEIRGSYFETDVTGTADADESITLIPADLGLLVSVPVGNSPITLHAMGGATWYFLDSDTVELDDEAGWYAGGGLRIAFNDSLALFAEAQYRSLEYTAAEDDVNELEENDVDFSAMTYNGGLILTW